MGLKLQVPWRRAPLSVQYTGLDGVIDEIRASNSPNVRIEGDDLEENDVLVENFFGMNNRVPDVSRYRICNAGCCIRHDNRYRICNDRYINPHCGISGKDLKRQLQPEIRNIVLLLESPHKDEYQPGNINCPIAPANGNTGDNIDRWLSTVLSCIEEQQLIVPGGHVIISNPIQFQTSLHAIHGQPLEDMWERLRNNVWWTLWNEQRIRQCFRERLVDTYNPCLIINACTGNFTAVRQRRNQDLRRNVTKFIREHLPIVPLYETKHPGRNNWTDFDNNCLQRIPQANQNAVDPQQ